MPIELSSELALLRASVLDPGDELMWDIEVGGYGEDEAIVLIGGLSGLGAEDHGVPTCQNRLPRAQHFIPCRIWT